MPRRLTIEERQERIDLKQGPNKIRQLRLFKTDRLRGEYECLVCEHVWETTCGTVESSGSGCPKCAKRLTLEERQERIDLVHEGRIKQLKLYREKERAYGKYECQICNHMWTTGCDNIERNGSGCPNCVGLVKLSLEDRQRRIDLKHGSNKIEQLRLYRKGHDKYGKYECQICNHIWETSCTSVDLYGTGCPNCATNTPDPDAPTIFYLAHLHEDGYDDALMIGITQSSFEGRYTASDRTKMTHLHEIQFNTWTEAKEFENLIKDMFADYRATNFPPLKSSKGLNGWSPEIFTMEISPYLESTIHA